ncbi:MAG: sporulation protein YunB [Candidatus Improbicoccus devescovinae]|nr:MAG: sporulation protein YunB [Candidatus Improbicoccus devescovinae]
MARRFYKFRKYKLKVSTKIKIILLFIFAILFILDFKLRPLIKSISADRARAIALQAINKAISSELDLVKFEYSDIAQIQRNEEGKLLGITTNIQKVNCLKANISSAILKEISKNEMREFGIPLGAILGIEILSGLGPIIPVKIFVTGNISADFESEFSEAGINQTKHLIYINTLVNICAMIPGYPTSIQVKTNITIAETIIVGEVPNVYATSEIASAKAREAKGLKALT